jgi:1-acyl-sn-glycerol-3-phosphate acyltransferase
VMGRRTRERITRNDGLKTAKKKRKVDPQQYMTIHGLPEPYPFGNSSITINSTYETIKFWCLLFTVLPIRVVFFATFFTMAWLFAKLSLWGTQQNNFKKTRLRTFSLLGMRIFLRLSLIAAGFWIRHNLPKSLEGAKLIVTNHISAFDVLYFSSFHTVAPVSDIVNVKFPFLGVFLKAQQAILVERKSPKSRKDTITTILNYTKSMDEYGWPPILIFPEGMTTNGSIVGTFRSGAFNPGVPVYVVTLRYPNKHLDLSYVDNMTIPYTIIRTFTQFVNYIDVDYLGLYTPSPQEKKHPMLYATNIRNIMSSALKVPQIDYTYKDVIRLEALKWGNKVPSYLHVVKRDRSAATS